MKKSAWKVYTRYDFTVEGRDGLIIVPPSAAEGNPWIWRAEYFDIYSQVDMVMLERGWHIAYYDVSHMYGCPESIRLMREFQSFAEKELHLAKKAILFGFSIGGLYSFNYAAEYPGKGSRTVLGRPRIGYEGHCNWRIRADELHENLRPDKRNRYGFQRQPH